MTVEASNRWSHVWAVSSYIRPRDSLQLSDKSMYRSNSLRRSSIIIPSSVYLHGVSVALCSHLTSTYHTSTCPYPPITNIHHILLQRPEIRCDTRQGTPRRRTIISKLPRPRKWRSRKFSRMSQRCTIIKSRRSDFATVKLRCAKLTSIRLRSI